jgi:hypothetical protein
MTAHPGKTKAQRLALDEIGGGNYSPMMARATREALLSAGLIVPIGERVIGTGPLAARVPCWEMPIPVHMQWCAYWAEQPDDAPLSETVTLECPKCGKAKKVARDTTDPPTAARVRVACPECNGGDFELIDYFDADGNQVAPG